MGIYKWYEWYLTPPSPVSLQPFMHPAVRVQACALMAFRIADLPLVGHRGGRRLDFVHFYKTIVSPSQGMLLRSGCIFPSQRRRCGSAVWQPPVEWRKGSCPGWTHSFSDCALDLETCKIFFSWLEIKTLWRSGYSVCVCEREREREITQGLCLPWV
jgi:hypothetical protein